MIINRPLQKQHNKKKSPVRIKQVLDFYKKTPEAYKNFQWKYTVFLMATVVGTLLIFGLPVLYLSFQNYHIFQSLAYKTEPGLLNHLEREMTSFYIFYTFSLTAGVSFFGFVANKIMKSVTSPLIHIDQEVRSLSIGDWTTDDTKLIIDEDLKIFERSFSYFYRTQRSQMMAELEMLEKIQVDEKNKDSVGALNALIRQKKSQLGLESGNINLDVVHAIKTQPNKTNAA